MPVIEKRYAQALADTCDKKGNFDKTIENFGELIGLLDSNRELNMLLLSPGIKSNIKKDIFAKVFANEFDETLKNLIFTLLDKGRANEIKNVFREVLKIFNEKKEVLTIRIFSTQSLTTDQIEKIKEIYKKQYNKKTVSAELVIDKSLVGGLKIQIGDKVIDSTVKERLADLVKITGARPIN